MIEGLKQKLQDEVERLNHEISFVLPKEIEKARAHGDLRENSEYKAALERQQFAQARVHHLRLRLSKLSDVREQDIPRDRRRPRHKKERSLLPDARRVHRGRGRRRRDAGLHGVTARESAGRWKGRAEGGHHPAHGEAQTQDLELAYGTRLGRAPLTKTFS